MFGEYQLYRCWNIGNVPENEFSLPLWISNGNNILVCGKQKHMAGRNFTA
jgi:hypothetical protein